MNHARSIELWKKHGDNLLMVQPFMDSVLERGDGAYMVDVDGNRILDMAAGQFCSVLGYGHRGFEARVKAQVEKLVHIGDQYVGEIVLECASALAALAPGDLNKVLLLSTGSEANECAIRIAKLLTRRTGMCAFDRGYYGISLATRTLSGISDAPGKFDFQPVPPNSFRVLAPVCGHCPLGLRYPNCDVRCLDTSIDLIGANAETIAGVIVEPIVSAGGMIIPSAEYMSRLYAWTKSIGALFIVDEAQTGFGRCGRWFDIEHYDIVPDMLVFSKTSGNGYPAGGLILRDELARELEDLPFTHLSSHQNDPLCAAAVLAVIEAVRDEELVEHSTRIGDYLMDGLRRLQGRHSSIVDVRGRGLMIGMELDAALGPAAAFNFAMQCEQRSLHLTYSYYEPVVRLIPPLVLTEQDVDFALRVMDEALTALPKLGTGYVGGPTNPRSGPFTKRLNAGLSPRQLVKKLWRSSPHDITQAILRRLS